VFYNVVTETRSWQSSPIQYEIFKQTHFALSHVIQEIRRFSMPQQFKIELPPDVSATLWEQMPEIAELLYPISTLLRVFTVPNNPIAALGNFRVGRTRPGEIEMASRPFSNVLRFLRVAVSARDGHELTDGQLLQNFAGGDERAFEVLVCRHGTTVLGVCRRVLRHQQDAEDAFQATFLVMARKAASIASQETVGNWLYGVAYRTAQK